MRRLVVRRDSTRMEGRFFGLSTKRIRQTIRRDYNKYFDFVKYGFPIVTILMFFHSALPSRLT